MNLTIATIMAISTLIAQNHTGNQTIPIEAVSGEILTKEEYRNCYKYGYVQSDKINPYKYRFWVGKS